MREAMRVVGRKSALVAGGLLLVSAGYWGGVAMFTPDTDTSPRSETTVTGGDEQSPSAETSAADPASPTQSSAPAATVDDVTSEPAPAPEPTSQPAPETIPAPQVNSDGSLPDGWAAPQNPGEPPVAPYTPPAAEKLPGEPGYTPPAG